MLIKHGIIVAAFAAFAWTAVAAQQNPAPPAGAAQGGRGAAPAGGRQGGGGPARGSFPQQQRPLAAPEILARGQALYGVRCTACHGVDLRGGDQGGPNLLRSDIVLTDLKGEKIGDVVLNGRRGAIGTMPAFMMPMEDVLAIAEYIHSVTARAGRQGRPPEADTPPVLNVLVGDANAGQAYFTRACVRCHSVSGDLQGIATRVEDPRALQNLWVSGGGGGRGGGAADDAAAVKVTVTPPGAPAVSGRLIRIDDFIVTLVQDDGTRRTFARQGNVPRVQIDDPLEPHRRIVLELSDADMHNVTAYLATLR